MEATSATQATVDYDVHGLCGVRLIGAGPRETAAVDRQLGPSRGALGREPHITVRFVDRLEPSRPLRLIGLDDAAYTDDAFLVLRSKHKAQARVVYDVATLGGPTEIVCERGLPAVPMLVATINLTVLAGGALPLHASAFEVSGRGVVTTGWSKGGKTEAMLAFVTRGARFIGDEWVYVSGDGKRLYGLPEPIRLWDWHLAQLPELARAAGSGTSTRLRALRTAADAGTAVARRTNGRGPAGGLATRASALIRSQLHVDAAPEQLFGAGALALTGPFDRLFLVTSTQNDVGGDAIIVAEPVDPALVAARMAASLRYERAPLIALYEKFRFAFPQASNELLETAAERERELLRRVFDGKPAWEVRHPYPLHFAELHAAMAPHC
jgi:hypothetical protein